MFTTRRLAAHAAHLVGAAAGSFAEFCHGLDEGLKLWREYGKDYPCRMHRGPAENATSFPRQRSLPQITVDASDIIGPALPQ